MFPRAWLANKRLQAVEWMLSTGSASSPSLPATTRKRFNSAVKLSEAMLREIKLKEGLQGPLKAQLFEGAEPVGTAAFPSPARSRSTCGSWMLLLCAPWSAAQVRGAKEPGRALCAVRCVLSAVYCAQ